MAALDIFYSDFNDVNFYVEDADQENLYEVILRKLFSHLKVARIFPLGGKAAVLEHARSDSNIHVKNFRAYIVDRDFDYLLGKQCADPRVFYIDRFCIESHLLEVPALVEIVVENHPKKRRAEVEAALSLDSQISSIYVSLRRLFKLFLCSQGLDLGIRNCSCPPEAFCKPRRLWELNEAAVVRYVAELKEAARAKLIDPPLEDFESDPRALPVGRASKYELVSGKFVVAMVFHYVKSQYSLGSMTFESFVYRLAKNSDLFSMRPFAGRVGSAIRNHRVNRATAVGEEDVDTG
jgi:hypothetical protein